MITLALSPAPFLLARPAPFRVIYHFDLDEVQRLGWNDQTVLTLFEANMDEQQDTNIKAADGCGDALTKAATPSEKGVITLTPNIKWAPHHSGELCLFLGRTKVGIVTLAIEHDHLRNPRMKYWARYEPFGIDMDPNDGEWFTVPALEEADMVLTNARKYVEKQLAAELNHHIGYLLQT